MTAINDVVDTYVTTREAIFDHVGYVEDWRIMPLDDARAMDWWLVGGDPSTGRGCRLQYGRPGAILGDLDAANWYEASVYTQRHLPKWVYRGAELTLIVGDTHCDGNILLFLLDNAKERVL